MHASKNESQEIITLKFNFSEEEFSCFSEFFTVVNYDLKMSSHFEGSWLWALLEVKEERREQFKKLLCKVVKEIEKMETVKLR